MSLRRTNPPHCHAERPSLCHAEPAKHLCLFPFFVMREPKPHNSVIASSLRSCHRNLRRGNPLSCQTKDEAPPLSFVSEAPPLVSLRGAKRRGNLCLFATSSVIASSLRACTQAWQSTFSFVIQCNTKPPRPTDTPLQEGNFNFLILSLVTISFFM
jgi:hypothetical protein